MTNTIQGIRLGVASAGIRAHLGLERFLDDVGPLGQDGLLGEDSRHLIDVFGEMKPPTGGFRNFFAWSH